MSPAPEFQIVRPGLFYWQAYDPAVKTDLCCCALEAGGGVVFCDPVPLDSLAEEELMAGRKARAIVLTNANHERNAAVLARRYGIEIWAHAAARGHVTAHCWYEEGPILDGELEAVTLKGFAAGETVLWWRDVLLMGDALINLPPYGFSVLPRKYCEDADAGAESLKKLLRFPVETLTFAHGLPLVSRARERLAELIGEISG